MNKITIITGAGFTITEEFAGISTESITNSIRELVIDNLKIDGLTPGEYFYRVLAKHYTVNPKAKDINLEYSKICNLTLFKF